MSTAPADRKKASSPLRPVNDEARALAAKLLGEAVFGALAHCEPGSAHPVVTRVGLATDATGVPVILISELSAHFQALRADPRCSLLVGEPGKGDPLAHPRMTVIGVAEAVSDATERAALRTLYLRSHPKAALYIDFADFWFWKILPERAALNGGFGKAYALQASDLAQKKGG